ncbi:hypothetical protein AGIG_G8332 [Arapaima gigas]
MTRTSGRSDRGHCAKTRSCDRPDSLLVYQRAIWRRRQEASRKTADGFYAVAVMRSLLLGCRGCTASGVTGSCLLCVSKRTFTA